MGGEKFDMKFSMPGSSFESEVFKMRAVDRLGSICSARHRQNRAVFGESDGSGA